VSGDPKEIGEDGLLHINSGETAATYGYKKKSVASLSEIMFQDSCFMIQELWFLKGRPAKIFA